METKDKLMSLVNSCIDNPNFYNNHSDKPPIIKHYDSKNVFYSSKLFLDYKNSEEFFKKSTSYDERERYILNELKSYKRDSIKVPSEICITFENEPPIKIFAYSKGISREKKKEKTFLTVDKFMTVKEKVIMGIFKKMEEVYERQEVVMELFQENLETKLMIQMGNLKENITLEEFETFSKRIIENTKKFKISEDLKILDERMDDFCK